MIPNNPLHFEKKPTVSELWKNEKKQYRLWIFLYLAVLVLSLILITSEVVILNSKNEANPYLWTGIISISLFVISIINFAISIFQSYKNKSFISIGQYAFLPTMFANLFSIGIGFYILSNIVIQGNTGAKISQDLYNSVTVITVLLLLDLLLLFPFLLRQVSKIRNEFRISYNSEQIEKQMEEIKNNPEKYNAFMNMFGQFGSFGQQTNSAKTNKNSYSTSDSKDESNFSTNNNFTTKKEEQIYNKVNNLSITELHKLAQKLEISSYSEMDNKELVNIIVKILSSQ